MTIPNPQKVQQIESSNNLQRDRPKFSMGKVTELIRVHVSTVSRLMDSGKLGYYQSISNNIFRVPNGKPKRLLRTDVNCTLD